MSLAGHELPQLLLFESASIREVTKRIFSRSSTVAVPVQSSPWTSQTYHHRQSLLSAPASVSKSVDLRAALPASGDAVGSVPAARWGTHQVPLSACFGHFLMGAEQFANMIFGISPSEASLMDPQVSS